MKVITGCSLPPLVEGQLRCFLSVKVGELEWGIPHPPKDVQVRVLWWGEQNHALLLRAVVESDPCYLSSEKVVEAHFPVRCGPKQFNAYLTDMKSLLLDVVYGPTCVQFARVDIPSINTLSSSNPLFGKFPVMCSVAKFKTKQVGSLYTSLSFKSISDAYNMSSAIIPTTDKQFKGTPSKRKKLRSINKPKLKTYVPGDERFDFIVGPASTEDASVVPPLRKPNENQASSVGTTVEIIEPIITKVTEPKVDKRQQISPRQVSPKLKSPPTPSLSGGNDILSTLLDRGHKLRDSMIKANIHTQQLRQNRKEGGSCGLLEEILASSEADVKQILSTSKQNIEEKAVDLILCTDHENIILKELSDESMIESEAEDPMHDSSLLNDLFYAAPPAPKINESSILFSDEDAATPKKAVLAEVIVEEDEKSTNSDSPSSSEEEDLDIISGTQIDLGKPEIDVGKLTSLGRVKSAKIRVNSLEKNDSLTGSVFLVEFELCTQAIEGEIEKENIQVVSRRPSHTNDITFDRILVFPMFFDKPMVDLWKNKIIQVKIFSKQRMDAKPMHVAEAFLNLGDVITSDDFRMDYKLETFSIDDNEYMGVLNLSVELSTGKRSTKVPKPSDCKSSTITKPDHNQIQKPPPPIQPMKPPVRKTPEKSSLPHKIIKSPLLFSTPQTEDNIKPLSLHNLVSISEGRNVATDSHEANVYCVCKVFWSPKPLKSKIVWNNYQPEINLQQVLELKVDKAILCKCVKNFLFIEVWNKSTTTESDRLIGMCKVPLHSIASTFRDSSMADIVLKSQYPVIIYDGWLPVMDLLSGREKGSIKLLLAVGLYKQIENLLDMQNTNTKHIGSKLAKENSEKMHIVELRFEQIGKEEENEERFVRYQFPYQDQSGVIHAKDFSVSFACDVALQKHVFTLPSHTQLQSPILKCLDTSHIHFQIWKRVYRTNCTELMVGKASVDLSRMCAFLSMGLLDVQKQQKFVSSLSNDAGSLDIVVKYSSAHLHCEKSIPSTKIQVNIIKLSGLEDSGNTRRYYVRFFLSFLGERFETPLCAPSNTPTFHHCTLINLTGNNVASQLEHGHLVTQLIHDSSEETVGEVWVPLVRLLTTNTGQKNWFTLLDKNNEIKGGINVAVTFCQPNDREDVVNSGRSNGWQPSCHVQLHDDLWVGSELPQCTVDMNVRRISVPFKIQANTIYLRYKFYDQSPVRCCSIEKEELNNCVIYNFQHFQQFLIKPSASFAWYLREELLEVEFWITTDEMTDILLGSIYVCLEQFSHKPNQTFTISDSYPLFNASRSNCSSKADVTISFNSAQKPPPIKPLPKPKVISPELQSKPEKQPNVRICIDEALHLSLNTSDVYVTYVAQDTVITTHLSKGERLQWKYTKEEYVVLKGQFEFRVMRCVKSGEVRVDRDVVVGIVCVDLSPLYAGMHQLHGWYNVVDLNEQTIGQIKVGICPMKPLSPSKSSKFFKRFDKLPLKNNFALISTDTVNKNNLLGKLHTDLNELETLTSRLIHRNSCHVAQFQDGSTSTDNAKVFEEETICEKDTNNVEKKEENEDLNDSTDELLGHLEQFKKKFSNLKDISDFDEDSYVSETDFDYNFEITDHVVNVSTKTTARACVTPVATPETCDATPEDKKEGHSNQELVNTSVEGENSSNGSDEAKEDLITELILKQCEDALKSDTPTELPNNEPATENDTIPPPIEVTERTVIKRGERTTNRNEIHDENFQIQRNPINVPNFFMKPEKMAESINALRIAANFRKSPRESPRGPKDPGKRTTADKSTDKPNLDSFRNASIDSTEVERISKIFLSKN